MDELIKKYSKPAKASARTALKMEQALQSLKLDYELLIEQNITKYKKGAYLPSNATVRVMNKHRNVLQANRDVYLCNQAFIKVKELSSVDIVPKTTELMADLRTLRDNLRTDFFTDIDVPMTLKTLKHQEAAFDLIFKEMLKSYTRGKIFVEQIDKYDQFLKDGMYQLGSLGKYLYNYSNMQYQEMVAEENSMGSDNMITNSVERPKKTVVEDSLGSRSREREKRVEKTSRKEELLEQLEVRKGVKYVS